MGEVFDTSGEVGLSLADGVPFEVAGGYTWEALPNDFVRGFIEALFADLPVNLVAAWLDCVDPFRIPSYRALSREALAMILADCERAQHPDWTYSARDGGHLWNDRQAGKWATLPPLRVSLSDDGKIHLQPEEAGQ